MNKFIYSVVCFIVSLIFNILSFRTVLIILKCFMTLVIHDRL